MTDLITEAREMCENARPGPYDVRNDNDGTDYFPFWVISRETDDDGEWFAELRVGDFPTARFFARSRTLIPELCDALENTEKQLQEQFDKIGAWLEEYNEMKMALEKAEKQNKQLMYEVCKLACESLEREKNLARLEAEVEALQTHMPLSTPPEKEGE